MNTQFILIRHAPILQGGALYGRSDVAARLPAAPPVTTQARGWDADALYLTSPAQRCRMTAQYLAPAAPWQVTQALSEQDFGLWEGRAYADIPDLGALSRDDLARHRPPQGERFLDLLSRVTPIFTADYAAGQVVVMAHAGVIRAALSLALGWPSAGLAFTIDPLSQTCVTRSGGDWAIGYVNRSVI